MAGFRTFLASLVGALALSVAAAPVVQAQPLPGGSIELPPIEPMPVAVPPGSVAQQLPPLPFPLFWDDPAPAPAPAPPAPRYVASNWVFQYSGCPAANQRAYAQDGTQLWCTYLDRTDARLWAPHTTPVPWSPDFRIKPTTRVANSVGAKPCPRVGDKAIDPSNGQEAYCAWQRVGIERLIWQYEPGS